MSHLQLRPPYLDTNSFLSPRASTTSSSPLTKTRKSGTTSARTETTVSGEKKQRKLIAREEAKLEKEIITIIHSGKGHETLEANSGQSISIVDHNICVGVHAEEEGSKYRVWEWHGHIMFFDELDGYSAEYIYGNYFKRLTERRRCGNYFKRLTERRRWLRRKRRRRKKRRRYIS